MGLAFSRDTSSKVYIQHKIREDGEMLARYLAPELDLLNASGGEGKIVLDQAMSLAKEVEEKDKGYFFLCGPTWPVPDIYEELVGALSKKGLSRKEAEDRIELLKEEERYVLEVVSMRCFDSCSLSEFCVDLLFLLSLCPISIKLFKSMCFRCHCHLFNFSRSHLLSKLDLSFNRRIPLLNLGLLPSALFNRFSLVIVLSFHKDFHAFSAHLLRFEAFAKARRGDRRIR